MRDLTAGLPWCQACRGPIYLDRFDNWSHARPEDYGHRAEPRTASPSHDTERSAE